MDKSIWVCCSWQFDCPNNWSAMTQEERDAHVAKAFNNYIMDAVGDKGSAEEVFDCGLDEYYAVTN